MTELMIWRKFAAWLWPVLVSLVVLAGLAIPGSDLPAPSAMLTAIFAILTTAAFIRPMSESPPLLQRKVIKWLLVTLAFFSVSIAISAILAVYDHSAVWLAAIKLGGVICAFALGLRCSLTDERAKRMLDVLLYVGGAWAVASIIMFILDPYGIYGIEKFGAGRLTGAFSSPNSAGTFFGTISVVALGRIVSRVLMRRERHIVERIDPIMTAVCVSSLAALMLTVSRGAIFSTIVCMAGLLILLLRNSLSRPRLAAVATILIAVLVIVFATPLMGVIHRLDGIDRDALVRTTIFRSHLIFDTRHMWFGAGPGAFNTVNSHIVSSQDYSELSVIRAMHNVYLQWFEETGLIGLAALVLLNLAVVAPMISGARRRVQMGGRIWAILAGYTVFLLHGFTDYAFQEPTLALFVALLLGCGFAMACNVASSRRSAADDKAV